MSAGAIHVDDDRDVAQTDAAVLRALVESDGAILGFTLPNISGDESWQPVHAFADAHGRNVIRFDDVTDCYVHPDAIAVNGDAVANGYAMPEAA